MSSEFKKLSISQIAIKEGRIRKDLGDLEGLAAELERDGLLKPILVNAARQLSWTRPHLIGLVFADANGDYLDPKKVARNILNPALDAAKLPHIRFHDLRGIAITLMLESGMPLKMVMEQVGHKTPAITLAVYSRVTKEAGLAAMDRLQRHVFG